MGLVIAGDGKLRPLVEEVVVRAVVVVVLVLLGVLVAAHLGLCTWLGLEGE